MIISPKWIGAVGVSSALLFTAGNAFPAPHGDHHDFKPDFNVSIVTSPHKPTSKQHQAAHGHSHSNSSPLLEYNETQVLGGHAPDPLAFISYDLGLRTGVKSGSGPDAFDVLEYHGTSHGWLMVLHVFAMTFGFFVALPLSITLRTANHWMQSYVHALYAGSILFGWVAGTAYSKSTPNLYEGNVHAPIGKFLVLFIFVISSVEFLSNAVGFLRRFFIFVQSFGERGRSPSVQGFWEVVVRNKRENIAETYESLGLIDPDAEELELATENLAERAPSKSKNEVTFEASPWANEQEVVENHFNSYSSSSGFGYAPPITTNGTRSQSRHHRNRSQWSNFSNHSDSTLHNNSPTSTHSPSVDHESEQGQDSNVPVYRSQMGRSQRVMYAVREFIERLLVVLAYGQLVIGSTVYTGICRENYLNGCLAHLIKGSIFFIYGLVTFGRYVGAFSDRGWAWNCLPKLTAKDNKRDKKATKRPVSAEMVESGIIFVYGATNTWMERFGAEPGSPYTAKQIQHISIAVMYFFAGAIGMALEIRPSGGEEDITHNTEAYKGAQPYRGSFNPFVAICIGITGIAMAAHHQTYLFQVQIHTLWGSLLSLYAVFRCLTYFFMWISPPRTTQPSRPPTEAVASFFLTAGGLTFISSTEQIGFWAMRSHRDDVMMFLNFVVAVTFLCFTWVFGILSFRKYILDRVSKSSEATSVNESHRMHQKAEVS